MAIILGLGEVLWDIFETSKTLGGAPANFSFHCLQLGHNAHILSRIGEDELGGELIAELKAKNVSADNIQSDTEHPTGTVHVEMTQNSHRFTITENVAWDFLQTSNAWLELARRADAVCFGTLAQRHEIARKTIHTILDACGGLKVFDINLRQNFYTRRIIEKSLDLAGVLKLNDEELPTLNDLLNLGETDTAALCRKILHAYHLDLICLTRGADGAMLISQNQLVEDKPAPAKIVDTVGCGDAFTAVLVHGLLAGKELEWICRQANRVGSYVASQTGGTPLWSAAMREEIAG